MPRANIIRSTLQNVQEKEALQVCLEDPHQLDNKLHRWVLQRTSVILAFYKCLLRTWIRIYQTFIVTFIVTVYSTHNPVRCLNWLQNGTVTQLKPHCLQMQYFGIVYFRNAQLKWTTLPWIGYFIRFDQLRMF